MLEARRERVLDAAEVVLAEVGVTATMDEIAVAAGIGRRTLFRYFPTREQLIAAAIARGYQRLDEEVFDEVHLEADDAEGLIRRVLKTTHRVAARMGKAHWQVAADREVLDGLGDAAAARRHARQVYAAVHQPAVALADGPAGRRDGWPTRSALESLHLPGAAARLRPHGHGHRGADLPPHDRGPPRRWPTLAVPPR